MGWCQEFGLPINEGCDHAMAAGHEQCACPACGVVCPGRFSGCSLVWLADPASGKQPALAAGPGGSAALSLAVAPATATNGHAPPQGQLPPGTPRPDVESLAKQVDDLRSEVTRLTAQMKELVQATVASSPETVLRGVDARFEWLTKQLSDRLVVLGNEVVAVKRQLGERVGP
jgi:hypothetical protein